MIKISKVKLDKQVPVYDITVPETTNFFANNVLVHNCSEISLPSKELDEHGPARTFVCCLSSINLEKYDEWKDNPLFISDIVEMLDNVLTVFIEKSQQFGELSAATYSAMRERSIGIGALGWHALLQKRNIPFETALATSLNKQIWHNIYQQIEKAERRLAIERGEPPDLESNVIIESTEGQNVYRSSDVVLIGRGLDPVNVRAFELEEGDKIFGTKGGSAIVTKVIKKEWAGKRRNACATAIAPNACQVKTNILKTTKYGDISLESLLLHGGVNVGGVEKTFEKQWVDFNTPVEVPTLGGNKEVSKAWYNGYEPVYEIEFEDGTIHSFTENHKLLVRTITGETVWVNVGDLTGLEELATI